MGYCIFVKNALKYIIGKKGGSPFLPPIVKIKIYIKKTSPGKTGKSLAFSFCGGYCYRPDAEETVAR